ncbi:uncharacterized protein LOC131803932 [Musca domestica]|uniref:Regulatory protein zeste n=1 Tax=Musca domestica TaxID=7370 RepID=A0A1I8N6X4_MUSDO|nr:uncharacterized protein LOC131803932 [Musca domestica]XP_058981881.1 uncharacterized protein LOC131803932 [Musca domestica]
MINMRIRKSQTQSDILVKRMKEHPEMVNGFPKGKKKESDEFWSKLTVELNANGPPFKETATWKKTWNDWKIYVRKKVSVYRHLITTKTEVELLNLLGMAEKRLPSPAKKNLEEDNVIDDTSLCNIVFGVDDSNSSTDSCRSNSNESPLPKRKRLPSSQENENTVLSDTSIKEDLIGFPSREPSQNAQDIPSKQSKVENKTAHCFDRIFSTLNDIYKIQKETKKENERHHRAMEELLREKNMIKMRSLELQELKYKFEMEKQQGNDVVHGTKR